MHHEWKAAIARADTLANSLQTLLDTRLASPLPVTAFGRLQPVATSLKPHIPTSQDHAMEWAIPVHEFLA